MECQVACAAVFAVLSSVEIESTENRLSELGNHATITTIDNHSRLLVSCVTLTAGTLSL